MDSTMLLLAVFIFREVKTMQSTVLSFFEFQNDFEAARAHITLLSVSQEPIKM